MSNVLRIQSPDFSATVRITTGSDRSARRVPARVAKMVGPGAVVEVQTTRGWAPRRIVKIGGRYYTRVVPTSR
jgi:hypothetical protein